LDDYLLPLINIFIFLGRYDLILVRRGGSFNTKIFNTKNCNTKIFNTKNFNTKSFNTKIFNIKIFNIKIFNNEILTTKFLTPTFLTPNYGVKKFIKFVLKMCKYFFHNSKEI